MTSSSCPRATRRPLLWAVYAEAGIIPLEHLLGLRKISSDLEGHPTPRMLDQGGDGFLGQGLSVGVGMALAQRLDKSPARTFDLLRDRECARAGSGKRPTRAHSKLGNLSPSSTSPARPIRSDRAPARSRRA